MSYWERVSLLKLGSPVNFCTFGFGFSILFLLSDCKLLPLHQLANLFLYPHLNWNRELNQPKGKKKQNKPQTIRFWQLCQFPGLVQYVPAQKNFTGRVEDALEGQEQAASRRQKASVPEISITTKDPHVEHCSILFYLHFCLTSHYSTFCFHHQPRG